MAQKKYTELGAASTEDGTEIIAYVQGGTSVQGTLQRIANLSGGVLSVVTTAGTITLNFANKIQRNFAGATSFATPKTVARSNDTNAVRFEFTFEITNVAAVLTFTGYKMSDVRWDATSDEWEPAETGKYKAIATYDGTDWLLDISPSPYV